MRVLLLGIGNLLMGDEGVGVHFIKSLNKNSFPKPVEIVDGGTGGFLLLSYFESYDPVILVDACMDSNPPGCINLIKPKFASDFPKALSSHDIGLKDVIEALILRNTMPEIYLFTISIGKIQPMQLELSDALQSAIDQLEKRVHSLIQAL